MNDASKAPGPALVEAEGSSTVAETAEPTALAMATAPERPPFEPPKYLASLIASINDGAKAAQTGAFFFTFIGLYLIAVAFSTTDEDLLRERTIAISQIGLPVPVIFSFAVAPVIFVFLHVHTLIRYDMLAANMRQFGAELGRISAEDDRERCRHLLANVEFLRKLGASPGTALASRLFDVLAWFVVAGFPILVLLLVQLSALRYQDQSIINAQRAALVGDLSLLVWYLRRQWRIRHDGEVVTRRAWQHHFGCLLLFVVPIAFNLVWMGVPAADATTVGRTALSRARVNLASALALKHENRDDIPSDQFAESIRALMRKVLQFETHAWRLLGSGAIRLAGQAWEQPVDLLFCQWLHFGCRFLQVPYTLLLAVPADPDVLVRLRTDDGNPAEKDIRSVEGLNLRKRTLRSIDLNESRLYAAELIDADLRGAMLHSTSLKGANLSGAQLQGANLGEAKLQGADLSEANLEATNLVSAKLPGANLEHTELQGANLFGAELQGANLRGAQLQGANLGEAKLQGANLAWARLEVAELEGAQLQGAQLGVTILEGANLRGAQLQGAELASADLQAIDLRWAALWQVRFDEGTNLSLADLRGINFEAIKPEDLAKFLRPLGAIPNEEQRREVMRRVEEALTLRLPPQILPKVVIETEVPVVVDTLDHPHFSNFNEYLTTDEKAYDAKLAEFLANLAKRGGLIARSIVQRVIWRMNIARVDSEPARSLYPDLARRLLDERNKGAIHLPDDIAAKLEAVAKSQAIYDPAGEH